MNRVDGQASDASPKRSSRANIPISTVTGLTFSANGYFASIRFTNLSMRRAGAKREAAGIGAIKDQPRKGREHIGRINGLEEVSVADLQAPPRSACR